MSQNPNNSFVRLLSRAQPWLLAADMCCGHELRPTKRNALLVFEQQTCSDEQQLIGDGVRKGCIRHFSSTCSLRRQTEQRL